MNANRKADLQRKLTLAPVPKPPAGLAERIKSEIPKHLRFNVEKERERLSRSIAFDIRVAASILILVLSAYAALHLMTRVTDGGGQRPAAVQRIQDSRGRPSSTKAVADKQAAPATPPPAKVAKKQKAKTRPVRIAESKPMAPPPALPMAQAPAAAVAEEVPMREMGAAKMAGGVRMRDELDAIGVVERFARADAIPSHEVRVEDELVTTPFGKTMLRVSIDSGVNISEITLDIDSLTKSKWPALNANASRTSLYELSPTTVRLRYRQEGAEKSVEHNVQRVPWPAASRRTKAAVLANEWAHGGDAREIARLAREAGLNELADFVERNPR